MNEPAKAPTADRHRKVSPEKWSKPGLPFIKTEGTVISCTCGWATHHNRPKIRDDRAERHINKRHGGQAAWL